MKTIFFTVLGLLMFVAATDLQGGKTATAAPLAATVIKLNAVVTDLYKREVFYIVDSTLYMRRQAGVDSLKSVAYGAE